MPKRHGNGRKQHDSSCVRRTSPVVPFTGRIEFVKLRFLGKAAERTLAERFQDMLAAD